MVVWEFEHDGFVVVDREDLVFVFEHFVCELVVVDDVWFGVECV